LFEAPQGFLRPVFKNNRIPIEEPGSVPLGAILDRFVKQPVVIYCVVDYRFDSPAIPSPLVLLSLIACRTAEEKCLSNLSIQVRKISGECVDYVTNCRIGNAVSDEKNRSRTSEQFSQKPTCPTFRNIRPAKVCTRQH